MTYEISDYFDGLEVTFYQHGRNEHIGVYLNKFCIKDSSGWAEDNRPMYGLRGAALKKTEHKFLREIGINALEDHIKFFAENVAGDEDMRDNDCLRQSIADAAAWLARAVLNPIRKD